MGFDIAAWEWFLHTLPSFQSLPVNLPV